MQSGEGASPKKCLPKKNRKKEKKNFFIGEEKFKKNNGSY